MLFLMLENCLSSGDMSLSHFHTVARHNPVASAISGDESPDSLSAATTGRSVSFAGLILGLRGFFPLANCLAGLFR